MPQRLSAGEIAAKVFVLDSDRDERASQICTETLLTLVANDYSDRSTFRSPKRANFALRSLALRENFLATQTSLVGTNLVAERYGELLASHKDFASSENISAIGQVLSGLVDPQTRRGQRGSWLLYPFHEVMLWHDARPGANGRWDVRKVYMRGSGITLARLLVMSDKDSGATAHRGVTRLRDALVQETQMSRIITSLSSAIDESQQAVVQKDELRNWKDATAPELRILGDNLRKHTSNVFSQQHLSNTSKLWQFRNILALDFASHILARAASVQGIPEAEQYMLVAVSGSDRPLNALRLRSEDAYKRLKRRIREAIVGTLKGEIQRLVATEPAVIWSEELENRRGRLDESIAQLSTAKSDAEYTDIAIQIFGQGGYERPVDGFRVLCESINLLQGTGAFKFFSATPELFEALIGALSEEMPMTSREFFRRIFDTWGIVVSPEAAARVSLAGKLEVTDLAANARRAERMLVEAGLGRALSDSTTVVGDRVKHSV